MTKHTQLKKKFEDRFTNSGIKWITRKMNSAGDSFEFTPNEAFWSFIHSAVEETKRDAKKEVMEKIETVFDDYRSSNQKVHGKRRFGIPSGIVSNTKELYQRILSKLK